MADIETKEIGVNTSELDPEELQRLVENNKELLDNDISNIDHEVKDSSMSKSMNSKGKKEMIAELLEKDKLFDILLKSNNDLRGKVVSATTQYKDIWEKVKKIEAEEDESTLALKLKELEKEISANNAEIDHYKRSIDSLKNKLEFKSNLERALNLQNLLKIEINKNKELKRDLDSLSKLNEVQIQALSNYDKENGISEKIGILKTEIKLTKDNVKDFQEKYTRQDRFIKQVHEKIAMLENLTKKLMIPKIEIKKEFTKDELRETLEVLNQLKIHIKDNRSTVSNISKMNEDKLSGLIAMNKKIELDYKENDKLNKMLIYKKTELKRMIKVANPKLEKIENKNTKSLIENNGDVSHLFPQKKHSGEIEQNNNSIHNSQNHLKMSGKKLPEKLSNESKKLFSKNPMKKNTQQEQNANEDYTPSENSGNENDSNLQDNDPNDAEENDEALG